MQRAQAAITRRDWEPAIKAYRRVVRILPDFAPAWSDLGALYLATGKSEQAEQALQRAIANPTPYDNPCPKLPLDVSIPIFGFMIGCAIISLLSV